LIGLIQKLGIEYLLSKINEADIFHYFNYTNETITKEKDIILDDIFKVINGFSSLLQYRNY